MAKRHDVLEFAVLGVLSDGPLHGYELRKRLAAVLGPFRALSYGSLYPCLRRLQAKGLIDEVDVTPAIESSAPALSARRARVVYAISADGKEEFAEWANQPGPEAWEDEGFAAHMAFFGRTESRVRLRILEGRRSRLEERVDALRESVSRGRERADAYTLQLQQHGLDGAEREVRWLTELIQTERLSTTGTSDAGTTNTKEQ
ncbi:MAG: PadR family transcriptional regulator [Actinobacteria bacterium]|nr:PadR family transcriptional regulator [Actinomycetota bacterium]